MRYKSAQMLVIIWALNNITAQNILYAYWRILLDNFQHQITGNFNKLIKQSGKKNTTKITTPIFLVIKMYIGPTRLLENGAAIANYHLEKKLCKGSQVLNWGNNKEIDETVVDAEDNKNKAENPQKKNIKLKKMKMHKKHLSKAKKKLS